MGHGRVRGIWHGAPPATAAPTARDVIDEHRCCRASRLGAGNLAGRGFWRTGRCCAGSCSSSTPASSGNGCPASWASSQACCYRRQFWAKGVKPVIARRGAAHGSGLGTKRWVVEQTIALLHWFRRLRIRREHRDDIHEAFLKLACSLICRRRLQPALREEL
ncbi:hypothetical protein GCM10010211_61330 [Streptomyces albospinus]|uniref:Transposase n=1 Tax=Streptomyces albospinus TaxID=285515 RepID=A0ABQ2VHB0_9ACTN|nr:hypothetical protein GCM10010211_61330 [Streptomyces albospinus]